MPFFGLANFAGLFSFQLLTFVCRTPFAPFLSWVYERKFFPLRKGDAGAPGHSAGPPPSLRGSAAAEDAVL